MGSCCGCERGKGVSTAPQLPPATNAGQSETDRNPSIIPSLNQPANSDDGKDGVRFSPVSPREHWGNEANNNANAAEIHQNVITATLRHRDTASPRHSGGAEAAPHGSLVSPQRSVAPLR